jgi:hypothetical protein
MRMPRGAGALLLWAAIFHRGLFAQGIDSTGTPRLAPISLDQLPVRMTGRDVRYAQPEPLVFTTKRSVKALYVNAWAFGSSRLWELVRLADSTEINALVIDVKDDTGCLLYPSQVKTAEEIGANACVRTKNLRARLDTVVAHGIYPIARIVVAKDPLLAERKPEWSVQSTSGGLWRDRIDIAWVDAFNDSVWVYAAELAKEAIGLGFAEVQFDYVRFPDEPKERMETAIFAARRPGETQRASVRRHIQLLRDRLGPTGVPLTFDIFGLTASAQGDLGIGQVWEDFVDVADVVLPMVYPSHYYKGAFGFAWPNGEPYRVVRAALREAIERNTQSGGTAQIRPFLQAFTLGRRRPRYTPFEIREQIRAAEELGIQSWVLWNPRSVYPREALLPRRPARIAQTASGAGQ